METKFGLGQTWTQLPAKDDLEAQKLIKGGQTIPGVTIVRNPDSLVVK